MKRYGVYLAKNPFLDKEPAHELFAQVSALPKTGDGALEGEIQMPGKKLKLRARKLLGDDSDFFVTKLEEPERLELLAAFPMLAIDEDGEGRMARYLPEVLEESMAGVVAKQTITVEVADDTGKALEGVDVRLVVNAVGPVGVTGKTDQHGRATLFVNATHPKAVYLTAEPQHSHWPGTALDVPLSDGAVVKLGCTRLSVSPSDNIDEIFANTARDGKGIVVAIVDGGIGPHKDIPVAAAHALQGGGETAVDDNGVGHGTHVAGIVHRLAPNAELRSYRVFRQGLDATNASIVAAAIRNAVLDGAHLVNVSITFNQDSPALHQVLQLAQARGVVCICAAGNFAGPVLYPAKLAQALAVAACGRKGWPGHALDYQLLPPPATKFTDMHAATFTCFGAEITLTAPGVGIASAFPQDRRAAMSGTSMSAPVVTGLLATALGADAAYAQSAPDGARATAAMRVAFKASTLLGLPVGFEGHGIPFLQ